MIDSTNRLYIFIAIFTAMALLELISPWRKLNKTIKNKRWLVNVSLSVINTLALKTTNISLITVGFYIERNNIGILQNLNLNIYIEIMLSIIILDLIIYLQHLIFHKNHILWNIHKIHHSDKQLDVSSAIRFHPIEIIISLIIKLIAILIIGAPAIAIFIFEIILSSLALFNHSNILIPKKIDTIIKFLFVTPSMHRIHHSVIPSETNSNYSFNISIWDRIFKTYTSTAKKKDKIEVGLNKYKNNLTIIKLLTLPFKK